MPALSSPTSASPVPASSSTETTSSHPTLGKPFSAFLFDMDGTLLNSIAAAERVWGKWALAHGLDLATFLPFMHGKRGIDTITQLNLPGVDPAKEAAYITQAEIDDVEGVKPIPGALEFLKTLPSDRWAIVTSSPLPLARARLAKAGITAPKFLVTAEDVTQGKPAPDCYRLGAERVGFDAADCLVFEDVPAGVKAGEAAGADVAVVTTTHEHPMDTTHLKISGYEGLAVEIAADGRLMLVEKSGA
ncbi:sugar-phosphatase [Rhizobium sp. PP-F2F-G38]|nr:sugar-phosphatase [Rhizobium sp. PP-WC-1G-195]PYE98839.1 sugar-phosphatase [Rhizobium sp. PP-F2F-G38]TCP89658.1 sugar-phosphatase [Rhizobium sp. PP-CC-2G-626]TCQ29758.1 sugar-phosphatase [Rhizobium sp. PP-CC-3G-465]